MLSYEIRLGSNLTNYVQIPYSGYTVCGVGDDVYSENIAIFQKSDGYKLQVGQKVVLDFELGSNYETETELPSLTKEYRISGVDETENRFSVRYDKRYDLNLTGVSESFEEGNTYWYFTFNEPHYFYNGNSDGKHCIIYLRYASTSVNEMVEIPFECEYVSEYELRWMEDESEYDMLDLLNSIYLNYRYVEINEIPVDLDLVPEVTELPDVVRYTSPKYIIVTGYGSDEPTYYERIEQDSPLIDVYAERDDFMFDGSMVIGVSVKEYSTSIDIPLECRFSPDVEKEDNIIEHFSKVANGNSINRYTEMEKKVYHPVIHLEDGTYEDVYKIKFNMHFREHRGENWTVAPNSFWNGVNSTNGILDFMNSVNAENDQFYSYSSHSEQSDLLGLLGFTDNDVKYQKNKVKKSFLRLSFYDSPNSTNQNLLCYSTVFMDGAKLYSKMMKKYNIGPYTSADYNADTVNQPVPITTNGNNFVYGGLVPFNLELEQGQRLENVFNGSGPLATKYGILTKDEKIAYNEQVEKAEEMPDIIKSSIVSNVEQNKVAIEVNESHPENEEEMQENKKGMAIIIGAGVIPSGGFTPGGQINPNIDPDIFIDPNFYAAYPEGGQNGMTQECEVSDVQHNPVTELQKKICVRRMSGDCRVIYDPTISVNECGAIVYYQVNGGGWDQSLYLNEYGVYDINFKVSIIHGNGRIEIPNNFQSNIAYTIKGPGLCVEAVGLNDNYNLGVYGETMEDDVIVRFNDADVTAHASIRYKLIMNSIGGSSIIHDWSSQPHVFTYSTYTTGTAYYEATYTTDGVTYTVVKGYPYVFSSTHDGGGTGGGGQIDPDEPDIPEEEGAVDEDNDIVVINSCNCNGDSVDHNGVLEGGGELVSVLGIRVDREPCLSIIDASRDGEGNIDNDYIEEYRLSSQIVVEDRMRSSKTSEGFYLYLWDDNDNGPVPTDIYMKAEFNHAGYGRTIPFMVPFFDENVLGDKGIKNFCDILHDWVTEYTYYKCVTFQNHERYRYEPVNLTPIQIENAQFNENTTFYDKPHEGVYDPNSPMPVYVRVVVKNGYDAKKYDRYSYVHFKYLYNVDTKRHIYYLDDEFYGNCVQQSGKHEITINLYEAKLTF